VLKSFPALRSLYFKDRSHFNLALFDFKEMNDLYRESRLP
jgi:hypothetical protein